MGEYQICKRCIMDTTDPDIIFDEKGYCNHCTNAVKNIEYYKTIDREQELKKIIERIKKKGQGKKYDCIIGVSGGVDSSYLAYKVKEFGLRPLAVHLDNGWDSELAVTNIKNLLTKLDIDLYTYVLDWEEFRSLQVAFLKASTPDSEIPTDHAILALMRKEAARYNASIIIGSNLITESIMAKSWSQGYQDWEYIKRVNKLYGTKKLKNFPHISIWTRIYYNRVKRQKMYCLLDYLNYNKEQAKKFLIENFGWKDYGSKHHESIYTKFYQNYILPTKFGFDKRKAHLSSLIVAGQITREEALEKMKEKLYNEDELKEHLEYVPKKLGISRKEFEAIMKTPPAKYTDVSPKIPRLIMKLENEFFKKIIKIKKQFFK